MNAKSEHTVDRLHATEARWFALRTAHRHEKVAAAQLARNGIPYFLPLQRVRRHYRRKVVERELCLLPGYVFVHVSRAALPALYRIPQVSFLRVGRQRLDIPPAEIELLRRIVGDRELDLEWELTPFTNWRAGQAVEIIGGRLTGTRGIFVEKQNGSQLIVSLGLLPAGTGLRTQVHASRVRPVGTRLRAAQ